MIEASTTDGEYSSSSGPVAEADDGDSQTGSALRWVVKVLLAAIWVGICYLQVAMVGSRLFTNPPEEGIVGIQLVATVLIYLPVGLAAVAAWLARDKSTGFAVMVHVVSMFLVFLIWVL